MTTFAGVLSSPTIPPDTHLGAVLASLPFIVSSSSWAHLPHPLYLTPQSFGFGDPDRTIPTWVSPIPKEVVGDPAADLEGSRSRIATYVADHFPLLPTYRAFDDDSVEVGPANDEGGTLVLGAFTAMRDVRPDAHGDYLLELGDQFGKGTGNQVTAQVMPIYPGNDRPCAPLIAWWAALFGLSVLARYEPAMWTRSTDIDHSADGVALEEILDHSLDVLPALLQQAIRRLDTRQAR